MDPTGANIATLQRRSQLLRKLRQFFYERGFAEVETPLLADEIIPELHIEPIEVLPSSDAAQRRSQYLQSSPELQMKRLVATGLEAIFEITRSFRAGERGPLHHPEFTIVEWYRTGDDVQAGMQLLDDLCQAILETPVARRTSYTEAFEEYANINPLTATIKQFADRVAELEIAVPAEMQAEDRDQWLNLLLAIKVEPNLGRNTPEILYHYPASQAALAKVTTREDGVEVAERFELYWQGIELANGYHELTDADELRNRLELVNRSREAEGKKCLPLPESLLAAMETGLPACAGCALGFDRLVMLACEANSIAEVRAFTDQ